MNKLQIELEINCPKTDHDQSKVQYFNFSDKIDEIFQCLFCAQEITEGKKIVLQQLMENPIWKIKNFPPIKDQGTAKLIREIIQQNQEFDIYQFKNDIIRQIEDTYFNAKEEMEKVLHKEKKEVLQLFENFFKKYDDYDIQNCYDIDEIKQAIKKFSQQQITLEQLYDIQVKIKEEVESLQKVENIQKQQNIKNLINIKLGDLKSSLQNKIDKFCYDDNFMKNFLDLQKQLGLSYVQDIQYENQAQKNILKLKKSLFNNNLGSIQILNNHSQQPILTFLKQGSTLQVYSQQLDKNMTHHIKMIINCNGNFNKFIEFSLIDYKKRDLEYDKQNYIRITSRSGSCQFKNGKNGIITGQKFSQFMKDDETKINVVFNQKDKLFEVYDEERKGYIINDINETIISDTMAFGIAIYQDSPQIMRFKILEYSCY